MGIPGVSSTSEGLGADGLGGRAGRHVFRELWRNAAREHEEAGKMIVDCI